MAFIGNTNTTQSFAPAIDTFNGDASTVAFTLSRPVLSVAQIQVVVENVPQSPNNAFSVSGNTLTFTSAPPVGSSNIYVYYVTTNSQLVSIGDATISSSQIADNAITTTKIADSAVTVAKISATGTPSSSTYLAGSGAWTAVTSLPGSQAQVFTSNGTFTIPTGITAIKVTVVGGGGGSGYAGDGGAAGASGGGGGGGAAIKFLTGLTPGNTLAVTVGAGGTAGTGGPGGTGGTSSVASGTQTITTVSATGGSGSVNCPPGNRTSGGAGGIGSNGDLNIRGGAGISAQVGAGSGGNSILGGGGVGPTTTYGAGTAGGNYGGGAGGSWSSINLTYGAAGGAGVVIFEW